MNLVKHNGGWAIVTTIVIAIGLTSLPLPSWADAWRPAWLALALIYWCMAVPARVGVGVGWILGLTLDISTGTLFGQHALGLALVAYLECH